MVVVGGLPVEGCEKVCSDCFSILIVVSCNNDDDDDEDDGGGGGGGFCVSPPPNTCIMHPGYDLLI